MLPRDSPCHARAWQVPASMCSRGEGRRRVPTGEVVSCGDHDGRCLRRGRLLPQRILPRELVSEWLLRSTASSAARGGIAWRRVLLHVQLEDPMAEAFPTLASTASRTPSDRRGAAARPRGVAETLRSGGAGGGLSRRGYGLVCFSTSCTMAIPSPPRGRCAVLAPGARCSSSSVRQLPARDNTRPSRGCIRASTTMCCPTDLGGSRPRRAGRGGASATSSARRLHATSAAPPRRPQPILEARREDGGSRPIVILRAQRPKDCSSQDGTADPSLRQYDTHGHPRSPLAPPKVLVRRQRPRRGPAARSPRARCGRSRVGVRRSRPSAGRPRARVAGQDVLGRRDHTAMLRVTTHSSCSAAARAAAVADSRDSPRGAPPRPRAKQRGSAPSRCSAMSRRHFGADSSPSTITLSSQG